MGAHNLEFDGSRCYVLVLLSKRSRNQDLVERVDYPSPD